LRILRVSRQGNGQKIQRNCGDERGTRSATSALDLTMRHETPH
jgi:hypothetical protein